MKFDDALRKMKKKSERSDQNRKDFSRTVKARRAENLSGKMQIERSGFTD